MEKLTFNQWVCKLSNESTQEIEAFEYIVLGIVKWWIEANPNKPFEENDLSTLKVLKLHFFICAVGTKKDSKVTLLDTFKFYAMPYGHVCKSVYDTIKKNKGVFKRFTLTNKALVLH